MGLSKKRQSVNGKAGPSTARSGPQGDRLQVAPSDPRTSPTRATLCDQIFEVTELPLTLCDAQGVPQYWAPHGDAPHDPPDVYQGLMLRYRGATPARDRPRIEFLEQGGFYAVFDLDPDVVVVIGPAVPVPPEAQALATLAATRQVPDEQRLAFIERMGRLPVLGVRRFATTVALIHLLLKGEFVTPEDILRTDSSLSLNIDQSLTHALFTSRERKVVHTPASFEHYVLQAVSEGNVPKLKQALLSPLSGAVGQMADDPLQQEKFTFVCFVTLVTRAAMAGGLNAELAYSLSDIYCQAVDRLHEVSSISRLSMDMCVDFTNKVATAQGRVRLSTGVSTCCEYISAHLHEDISLAQLARITRVPETTLSRHFRNETGVSIADYIHQERIKEAKALLQYSSYSISEIAYYLHYGSQSYFSTVFKRFSGVTPLQFREKSKSLRLL